ncbi:MAG: hypothetical protein PHN51_10135 [Candidatus Nanopelagicales bacterium]|nr:hypothetical protein [Candidatus Nanopelagicales bacterium]
MTNFYSALRSCASKIRITTPESDVASAHRYADIFKGVRPVMVYLENTTLVPEFIGTVTSFGVENEELVGTFTPRARGRLAFYFLSIDRGPSHSSVVKIEPRYDSWDREYSLLCKYTKRYESDSSPVIENGHKKLIQWVKEHDGPIPNRFWDEGLWGVDHFFLRSAAYTAAKHGKLAPDFPFWVSPSNPHTTVLGGIKNSLAAVAFRHNKLPEGFTAWDIKDAGGNTFAEYVAKLQQRKELSRDQD